MYVLATLNISPGNLNSILMGLFAVVNDSTFEPSICEFPLNLMDEYPI
jgi:hypothetical protein